MAKETVVLDPQRIGLVEDGRRQDWVVTAEFGTTPEQVLDTSYWAHVSSKFSPYDHIEVRCDDGSWILELIVTSCDRNWARVFLAQRYDLTTADVSETQVQKHKVQWRGPHLLFGVLRLSDSQVVQEKLRTKEEATAWMNQHEKAMG